MKLEQRIRNGAAWMLVFKLVDRVLMLLSTAILARILVPADFGLVAMASLLVTCLELIRALGFDLTLIQNQHARREHYDTAWTLTVACGAVSAVGLLVLSVPFAYLLSEPRLVNVLAVLAVGTLGGALENIGVVAFRKELRLDREVVFLVGQRLVVFCTTVSLALLLRSFWALVAGVVVGRLAGTVLSYYLHPYRPKFCISASGELIGSSKWLLLNGITSYLHTHAARFILTGLGARPLGLFTVADQISRLPLTEVVVPLNGAIFPGYAKLATSVDRLRHGFLRVLATLAVFTLPTSLGIAATAELLVGAVLGDKWVDAVPLIRTLAFCGAITALCSNIYFVFVALGRVRSFWFLSGAYSLVLLVLLIILTGKGGAHGAATAHLLTAAICMPLMVWSVARLLEITLTQLWSSLWRPLIASSAMYCAVRTCSSMVITHQNVGPGTCLVAAISVGAGIYCATLLALWQLSGRPAGAEQFALNTLRSGWRGLRESELNRINLDIRGETSSAHSEQPQFVEKT